MKKSSKTNKKICTKSGNKDYVNKKKRKMNKKVKISLRQK